MSSRLIIDGNSVYEIDEECEKNGSGASDGKTPRETDGQR